MRACLVALALPDQLADVYRLLRRTLWPVPTSIARIRDRLAVLPDGSELVAFLPALSTEQAGSFRARLALASTFVAGSELARDGQLTLDQTDPWQIISVSQKGPGSQERRLAHPSLS